MHHSIPSCTPRRQSAGLAGLAVCRCAAQDTAPQRREPAGFPDKVRRTAQTTQPSLGRPLRPTIPMARGPALEIFNLQSTSCPPIRNLTPLQHVSLLIFLIRTCNLPSVNPMGGVIISYNSLCQQAQSRSAKLGQRPACQHALNIPCRTCIHLERRSRHGDPGYLGMPEAHTHKLAQATTNLTCW